MIIRTIAYKCDVCGAEGGAVGWFSVGAESYSMTIGLMRYNDNQATNHLCSKECAVEFVRKHLEIM